MTGAAPVDHRVGTDLSTSEAAARQAWAALFGVATAADILLAVFGVAVPVTIACAVISAIYAVLNVRAARLRFPVPRQETAERVKCAATAVLSREPASALGLTVPTVAASGAMAPVSSYRWCVVVPSADLTQRLTDGQLEGLIAHHLGHVAANDATLFRRIAWVTYGGTCVLAGFVAEWTGNLLVGALFALAMWPVATRLESVFAAPTMWRHEAAADRYAADLVKAEDLCGALTASYTYVRDLRTRLTGRPLRWLLVPLTMAIPGYRTIEARVVSLSGVLRTPADKP